jgi:hypothetical protein
MRCVLCEAGPAGNSNPEVKCNGSTLKCFFTPLSVFNKSRFNHPAPTKAIIIIIINENAMVIYPSIHHYLQNTEVKIQNS